MTKLEKAKEIIKENLKYAECGIFKTQCILPDSKSTLYDNDGLKIDICYEFEYFEVFGLTNEEFDELTAYYYSLRGWQNDSNNYW